MKKRFLAFAIIALVVTAVSAEKFDPVQYERDVINSDKQLQKQLQTDANIKECKTRMNRAKIYMNYVEKHPEINKKLSNSVLQACHERVSAVCGLIMAKQPTEK